MQTIVYEQLHLQHQSTRREQQETLLVPLQRLADDISRALADDKRAYESVKEQFRGKFNLFQRRFTSSATNYQLHSINPLKRTYHQRKDLAIRIKELLEETTSELAPMEVRTEWNGSVAVAYDPTTGRAEWRQCRNGGIHGVYNPVTRKIEWEQEHHTGVYGVFNPLLNIVEWKKSFKGGVHGVYNPSRKSVEWHISFNSGVGGVYNPLTKQIEWKTSLKGGVIGYFDYETETVKWIEKWHHGVAMILWDPTTSTYLTSASCGWYNDN